MPITIGGRAENDYTNPIGMLSDCHRRIEKFLGILTAVSDQARGGEMRDEQREAFDVALRYFREAAPRHTMDEEESLFPRMRASSKSEAQAILAQLDALNKDHQVADEGHRLVSEIGQRWLAEGRLDESSVESLIRALDKLQEIYSRHIAEEDNEVFPLAEKLLSSDEIKVIAREMAARRGIELNERMMPTFFQ